MKTRLPIAFVILSFFILVLVGSSDLPATSAASPQFVSLASTATPSRGGLRATPTTTPQPKISNPPSRANPASKSPTGNNIWTSIGPAGGTVSSLAIDPQTSSTLYAGTFGGGVFKSINGGASWTAFNNGLTNTVVQDLVIDPQTSSTLYAGTSGGLFKSTNGGANWVGTNNGLTATVVLDLAIDQQMPSTLYAGTFGGGVFKSTNGGASWSLSNNGFYTQEIVRALAIDPQTPSTLYAGTDMNGVFKSTNGGASWSRSSSGLAVTIVYALTIDPQTPSTLYAGTFTWGGNNSGDVFKSTNGGANWVGTNNGLTATDVRALAIDPQTPSTLYAGTFGGGVFKSTNGGASWTAFNNGLTNTDVQDLAIDPQTPSTLYAGTSGGGVFSTNQLPAWTLMYYLDGDNNLGDQYTRPIFNQLESVANNPNVNIVALWDKPGTSNSAYYEVQYDTNLSQEAVYVANINYKYMGELNMGDPKTLVDFVNWARTNYPAQHYALILSNHGSGLGGGMLDESTPISNGSILYDCLYLGSGSWYSCLTVYELGLALASVTSNGTNKIDVLYMDACLMGMIEDAYQVKDHINYYVASENIKWAYPEPHAKTVSAITATTTPSELASLFATTYTNRASLSFHPYTMSAADISNLNNVITATNSLAQALNSQMTTSAITLTNVVSPTVQRFDRTGDDKIVTAGDKAVCDDYIDLYDFARLVKANFPQNNIQSTAQSVMDNIKSYIITEDHQIDSIFEPYKVGNSNGVSIFFPCQGSSFYSAANYDFATGATWPHSPRVGIRKPLAAVDWGPMLVSYFQRIEPNGPDNPTPPFPIAQPQDVFFNFLPLIRK